VRIGSVEPACFFFRSTASITVVCEAGMVMGKRQGVFGRCHHPPKLL
jgi:hypothetical protein